jgi:hypothetical protein
LIEHVFDTMSYHRWMGTNRRYGFPADRDVRRRQRDAMLSPEGRRRLRHCWVDIGPSIDNADQAPGVVVEWARSRDLWYARVVYVEGTSRVVNAWFPYTRLSPVPR